MCNQKIKDIAKASNVKLWELADSLGISDGTLSRKLRKELTASENEKMIRLINDIARRKEMETNENAGH